MLEKDYAVSFREFRYKEVSVTCANRTLEVSTIQFYCIYWDVYRPVRHLVALSQVPGLYYRHAHDLNASTGLREAARHDGTMLATQQNATTIATVCATSPGITRHGMRSSP